MSLGCPWEGRRRAAPGAVPGQLAWWPWAALVVTRLGGFHGEEKLGRVLSSSEMGTGAGKWVTGVTPKP